MPFTEGAIGIDKPQAQGIGNPQGPFKIFGEFDGVPRKGAPGEPVPDGIEFWKILFSPPQFQFKYFRAEAHPVFKTGTSVAGLVVETPDRRKIYRFHFRYPKINLCSG
jgi:hypothetical protein